MEGPLILPESDLSCLVLNLDGDGSEPITTEERNVETVPVSDLPLPTPDRGFGGVLMSSLSLRTIKRLSDRLTPSSLVSQRSTPRTHVGNLDRD